MEEDGNVWAAVVAVATRVGGREEKTVKICPRSRVAKADERLVVLSKRSE